MRHLRPYTLAFPLALLLAAPALLPACAEEDSGDKASISIEGVDLDFVEDGVTLSFVATTVSEHTTQRAIFCGSEDPIPDAIDDERSLCVTVTFDSAALQAAAADQIVAVAGTTTIENGEQEYTAGPWSYATESGDGGVVTGLVVEQSCFCSHYGPYTQDWSGDLTITAQDDARITASISLVMDGSYTNDNFSGPHHLELLGSVDFDRCPTSRPDGAACATENVRCAYGYDPVECGGITFLCQGGAWVEEMHTDPTVECPSVQ